MRNEILDSKLGLVLFSFNRPEYLDRVIKSIQRNYSLNNVDFYLFQDGPVNKYTGIRYADDREIKECINIAKNSKIPWQIEKYEKNQGVGPIQYKAKKKLFDGLDYKYVLFLEDDIVLSRNYVRLIKLMLNQFEDCEGVGTVQCIGKKKLNLDNKKDRLRELCTGNYQLWAWATWKNRWKEMEPYFLDYYNLIKNMDYRYINIFKIKKFYLREGFKPKVPSQDQAIAYARYKAKMFGLNTVVNRIKYIGKEGTHQTKTNYLREGWNEVKLHEFNEDRYIESFAEINSKLFWQKQEQIYKDKTSIPVFWIKSAYYTLLYILFEILKRNQKTFNLSKKVYKTLKKVKLRILDSEIDEFEI